MLSRERELKNNIVPYQTGVQEPNLCLSACLSLVPVSWDGKLYEVICLCVNDPEVGPGFPDPV